MTPAARQRIMAAAERAAQACPCAPRRRGIAVACAIREAYAEGLRDAVAVAGRLVGRIPWRDVAVSVLARGDEARDALLSCRCSCGERLVVVDLDVAGPAVVGK